MPMDLMEGRYSVNATRRLVQSAADANFNMLRVWGGGVYEHRAFYDSCDDLGILLYHDLMFTWGSVDASINASGSNSSAVVNAELNHQLKRLSHHPSIVLWSACNECGGGAGSYDEIVMPIVAFVDRSRPIWPSSPSAGWSGGVDMLTARPNGKRLAHASDWGKQPDPPSRPVGYGFTLESHGPYSGMLNPFSSNPELAYINDSTLPQPGRTPSESCNLIKCPEGGCTNTKVCSWYASPEEQTGPSSTMILGRFQDNPQTVPNWNERILRVKPSARTHTGAPHCGSHCHQPLSLRVFLTLHSFCRGRPRVYWVVSLRVRCQRMVQF